MKKVIVGSLILILFIGCADVTPIEECIVNTPYGFWGGLWHGIIAPFAWIGIALYAVNNNGGWYDFGFILGIGALGGSVSRKK